VRARARRAAIAALAAAALACPAARADDEGAPNPFLRFGRSAAGAFAAAAPAGALGAGVTAAWAYGGVDQAARVAIQTGFASRAWGDTAVVLGYTLPVLVPLALYGAGALGHRRAIAEDGVAVFQAVVLTVAATTLLKGTIGRPYPNHGGSPDDPARLRHDEYSREFHPFGTHSAGQGAAWLANSAWPSGHASAMFAVAGALAACEARPHAWAAIAAYAVAVGVSAGMLSGDRHWLSDVIAGAAFGDAIGRGAGGTVCEGRAAPSGAPRVVLNLGSAALVGAW
jgi:membrane-associated phospholipid phosphatase